MAIGFGPSSVQRVLELHEAPNEPFEGPVPEADGRPQPRLKGSFGPQGSSLARIVPSLATEVPIWSLKSIYLLPKGPSWLLRALFYLP